MALAQGESPGGYKVPSLVGLAWTAPYLHDGGVAVGDDPEAQLGMPGTLLASRMPDPANSLRALVDRRLRAKVIAANRGSDALRASHVTGAGHDHWADEGAGVLRDDQDALILDLLTYSAPRR